MQTVLTLDNFSGHGQLDMLQRVIPSWLRIEFLPENTTSIIQPCDGGIIARFKRNYRKRLLDRLVDMCDANPNLTVDTFIKGINVLHAIIMMGQGWDEIQPEAITKVWSRTLLTSNTMTITAEGMSKAKRQELEELEARVCAVLTNMPALIARSGPGSEIALRAELEGQAADDFMRRWLDFDDGDGEPEFTIDDAVESLRAAEAGEDEEEEEEEAVVDAQAVMTHAQALISLRQIARYLEAHDSDVTDLMCMYRVIDNVHAATQQRMKQSTIDTYFKGV